MQEKDKDNFSFIHEKIKEKPVNKKKIFFHVGFVAGMAVIFGLVASFVFACFWPKFGRMMYPQQDPVITIPKDEETETTEGTETTEETETQVQEPVPEQLPEMTLEDFQKLHDKLYAVGREANKFVVTVTGVKSDTDWFNNPYERTGQASGIIIADNGKELLILTERKVISDVQEVYVTFVNEVSVAATMKKYDGNTGIAVLSVPHDAIGSETMNRISVATLGNSFTARQGMLVIAVGSPLGTNYSVLTGNITSTTNSISTKDHTYTVFTTDIVGSTDGSGVIINVKGEVIGLVKQDYSNEDEQGTLTAVSISELKGLIEMLSNNQDIPYIGLGLSTVTSAIAEEYQIPKGAYIKEVVMDSPAMAAGLQSGDVITGINSDIIFTTEHYETKLLSFTPGDRIRIVVQRQGTNGYTEISCMVNVGVLK